MQRILNIFIVPMVALLNLCFVINAIAGTADYAQVASLPSVGSMVGMSAKFQPPLIKGIKFHSDNAFQFDFILDMGDDHLNTQDIKQEGEKLISYFLASLTTPENEIWVNLSPYEKDRIIPKAFGNTTMGQQLLAQDYLLKQIMATALYPERELGKEFWKKVYKTAQNKFGTANISINTFNKVWIVPDKAKVSENAGMNTVFIVDSSLKVMLEQDYLALEKNKLSPDLALIKRGSKAGSSTLASQILREVVIPALEQEVNQGKNFAQLRQVYNSLILAKWYKNNLKNSVIAKAYVNRNKIAGVDSSDRDLSNKIYEQYLKAFRKGVYNFIKEEADPVTSKILPRKYFSGGFTSSAMIVDSVIPTAMQEVQFMNAAQIGNMVMVAANLGSIQSGDFEENKYYRDQLSAHLKQAGSDQDFTRAEILAHVDVVLKFGRDLNQEQQLQTLILDSVALQRVFEQNRNDAKKWQIIVSYLQKQDPKNWFLQMAKILKVDVQFNRRLQFAILAQGNALKPSSQSTQNYYNALADALEKDPSFYRSLMAQLSAVDFGADFAGVVTTAPQLAEFIRQNAAMVVQNAQIENSSDRMVDDLLRLTREHSSLNNFINNQQSRIKKSTRSELVKLSKRLLALRTEIIQDQERLMNEEQQELDHWLKLFREDVNVAELNYTNERLDKNQALDLWFESQINYENFLSDVHSVQEQLIAGRRLLLSAINNGSNDFSDAMRMIQSSRIRYEELYARAEPLLNSDSDDYDQKNPIPIPDDFDDFDDLGDGYLTNHPIPVGEQKPEVIRIRRDPSVRTSLSRAMDKVINGEVEPSAFEKLSTGFKRILYSGQDMFLNFSLRIKESMPKANAQEAIHVPVPLNEKQQLARQQQIEVEELDLNERRLNAFKKKMAEQGDRKPAIRSKLLESISGVLDSSGVLIKNPMLAIPVMSVLIMVAALIHPHVVQKSPLRNERTDRIEAKASISKVPVQGTLEATVQVPVQVATETPVAQVVLLNVPTVVKIEKRVESGQVLSGIVMNTGLTHSWKEFNNLITEGKVDIQVYGLRGNWTVTPGTMNKTIFDGDLINIIPHSDFSANLGYSAGNPPPDNDKDKAMRGGIDLEELTVQNSGTKIKTAFNDPMQLKSLLSADGLQCFIYGIVPISVPMISQLFRKG